MTGVHCGAEPSCYPGTVSDQARDEAALLRQVSTVLDESFHVLLELARKAYHDVSVASSASFRPRILVVDDDPAFAEEVFERLGSLPFDRSVEPFGGSALDRIGSQGFEVVAARADLPDLPGSMVVRTALGKHPLAWGIVYTPQPPESRLDLYLAGRIVETEKPFQGAEHLARALAAATMRVANAQRDRAVLRAFRSEHEVFLRRLAEVREALARRLPGGT